MRPAKVSRRRQRVKPRCCAPPSPAAALLFVLLLAMMAPVFAEQEALIPSSDPEQLTVAGTLAYFTADDGIHGRELWKSDGTPEGTQLVKDLEPGPSGTDFRIIHGCGIGGAFLFVARTLQQDWSLYRTDGTEEGTQLVFAFSPGSAGLVAPLAVMRDRLYLNVINSVQGYSLWTSDGTHDGTRPLDVHESPIIFNSCAVTNGGVLFLASHASVNLYQTDGTPEGTVKRKELFAHPDNLVAFGNRVAFTCSGENGGPEPWVADTQPDSAHPIRSATQEGAGAAAILSACLGDSLLFNSNGRQTGEELWQTDGTPDGTRLLKDINPGTPGSDPYSVVIAGNRCFFSAVNAEFGRELWVTDGTTGGTHIARDILPGHGSAEPYALCADGDRVFFSAKDGSSGEELWVSDGSEAGTRRVANIYAGPLDSAPYGTVAMNGPVLFAATDANHGRELWRSDGTGAGTLLVKDIHSRHEVNPSSSPSELTPLDNQLFFVANDIEHGTELWTTDGTETGTRLVRDLYPGSPGSNPHLLTAFNGLLYFAANDGNFGEELWCSDGTKDGTRMVSDINFRELSSAPREFAVDGQKALYFVAFAGTEKGNCIFAMNGAGEISCAVQTDRRPAVWNPHELRVWNDWLYFSADDGIHGEELWRTNVKETRMVRDIVPAPQLGALPHGLTAAPETLFFCANDGLRGEELWRLDSRGAVALVCDVRPADSYLPFGR